MDCIYGYPIFKWVAGKRGCRNRFPRYGRLAMCHHISGEIFNDQCCYMCLLPLFTCIYLLFILQIFTVLQVFNYSCILGKFAVSVVSYYYASLKTKIKSIWQLCRHWWHNKLSLRQLTVPPVTTKLSNWRSFVFSVSPLAAAGVNKVNLLRPT